MVRRRKNRINDDGTIRCRKCGEFKDTSEFRKTGETYRTTCKECESELSGGVSSYLISKWEEKYGPVPVDKMLTMVDGQLRLKDRSWTYVKVTVDGERVYLHRWIWEQANGPIPQGHVVHHIDHNIYNNVIENFQLMTKEEHDAHHQNDEERKGAQREVGRKTGLANRKVGPEGTSWCTGHQDFIPVENFTKSKSSWNGLDRRCRECKKKLR